MLPDHFQKMQVQSPRTELPNACMPICALKICTSILDLWLNVPASAAFVCYQRSAVCVCNSLREGRVFLDGCKAIVDGECRAFQIPKGFREVVIGLLWEYQVCCCGTRHLYEVMLLLMEDRG